MQKIIKLHDKTFTSFISASEIQTMVHSISKKINADTKDINPLFIGILKGAFLFTADLIRLYEYACGLSFIKVASYKDTQSTGQVKRLFGINEPLSNRVVIIVEDIIDTGNTLEYVYNEILKHEPNQLKVATLLLKPEVYKKSIKIDYVGKEIPNKFMVGYGLDYNELGRNLQDIYALTN